MNVEDPCPGEGECHGCLGWCDACGDTTTSCRAEDNLCMRHYCPVCKRKLTRDDHEAIDGAGYPSACQRCEAIREGARLERIAANFASLKRGIDTLQTCLEVGLEYLAKAKIFPDAYTIYPHGKHAENPHVFWDIGSLADYPSIIHSWRCACGLTEHHLWPPPRAMVVGVIRYYRIDPDCECVKAYEPRPGVQ